MVVISLELLPLMIKKLICALQSASYRAKRARLKPR